MRWLSVGDKNRAFKSKTLIRKQLARLEITFSAAINFYERASWIGTLTLVILFELLKREKFQA